MMKYLDPKADMTFKKVFGEHKNLVISLLNALLPLADNEQITEVEYLNPELIPDNPWRKNTIVDVRCCDQIGRQFLVEMQMLWSPEFKTRVFLNAAKAYVRQAESGDDYNLLQPVWSLNLLNDVFEPDNKEYYHHYKVVNIKDTNKVIEGLQLVFVELPKFKAGVHTVKKMHGLWLRYLTEINGATREISPELTSNSEVDEAIEQLRVSAFNDSQLYEYEYFWESVRMEHSLYSGAERRGFKKNRS